MTILIAYVIAQVIIIAIALPITYFTIGKRINEQLKSINEIGDRVGYQARVVDSTAASFMQNHEKWIKEIDIKNVQQKVHDTVTDQIIKVEQDRIDRMITRLDTDADAAIDRITKKADDSITDLRQRLDLAIQTKMATDAEIEGAINEAIQARLAVECAKWSNRLDEITIRSSETYSPIFIKHRSISSFMSYIERGTADVQLRVKHLILISSVIRSHDNSTLPEYMDDIEYATNEEGEPVIAALRVRGFRLNGASFERVSYEFRPVVALEASETGVRNYFRQYHVFRDFTSVCQELGI